MNPDVRDSTINGVSAADASNAALLVTFYVDQKKEVVSDRVQDQICRGLNLVQDRPGTWHTPDGEGAFLRRFHLPRAAHDTTILQLALNSPNDVAKAWEELRQRLEGLLSPEALDGIWGYTLTYQAELKTGVGADNVFGKLRHAVSRLHFDKEAHASLAQANVAGGRIWLMAVPKEGNGPAAGTVYIALSEPEKDRELGKALLGEGARLLMPDLIAHKSHYQRRQYQGRRYEEYKGHLNEFRVLVRTLLTELERREVRSGEVRELTKRYNKLAEMVWYLEDLRVSMARQLFNYDEWEITRGNAILQYHRRYIEMANAELDLLVSEGQYALGVAEPILAISRFRAEKAREEAQQLKRQEQEEEQVRTRRKVDMVVAVVATAVAVPELVNQKATAALLELFPLSWVLDRLFGIQELRLQNAIHVSIILAAQVVIIVILAGLFYLIIHRLFGESGGRVTEHT